MRLMSLDLFESDSKSRRTTGSSSENSDMIQHSSAALDSSSSSSVSLSLSDSGSDIVAPENLRGKKVIVRVDLNVPIQNGVVQDISRIKNFAPTIDFLKKAKAKIILISHLGKTATTDAPLSLKPLVKPLENEYKSNVIFIPDCLDEGAEQIIANASSDDLILLENLRIYKEEEACDKDFAAKLARLGDFYINEAFSVSHRKHASIWLLPQLLPCAFGLAFIKEKETIDYFLGNAKSPRMALVGGAKLDTKVNLLKNLVKKVDKLAIGGGIAGAFLAFLGNTSFKIASQKQFEKEVVEIIGNAKESGCELIFPKDFCALVSENSGKSIISTNESGTSNASISIFDIGPRSVEFFIQHIRESATILWNGPVGMFEMAPFDFGTRSLCKEIAHLTREGKITSIVGGGDTAFAVNKFGVSQDVTYKSTSGGAFLTYLERGKLPGISAAKNAKRLAYK